MNMVYRPPPHYKLHSELCVTLNPVRAISARHPHLSNEVCVLDQRYTRFRLLRDSTACCVPLEEGSSELFLRAKYSTVVFVTPPCDLSYSTRHRLVENMWTRARCPDKRSRPDAVEGAYSMSRFLLDPIFLSFCFSLFHSSSFAFCFCFLFCTVGTPR